MGFGPTAPANIRYLPVDHYPAATETESLPYAAIPGPQPEEPTWQLWLDSLTGWLAGEPIQP
jgi:hypothetical protein